eukprot:7038152-Pyramimonas_sp.AAC.1
MGRGRATVALIRRRETRLAPTAASYTHQRRNRRSSGRTREESRLPRRGNLDMEVANDYEGARDA